MNLDVNIRLDLSPAFAAALQELARALGGRSVPPPSPSPSPSPVPPPEASAVQVDTVADIEVGTAPGAAPASAAEQPRWTEERNALLTLRYRAGDEMRDILPRLNALPGPAISFGQMRAIIVYRKLKRGDAAPAAAASPTTDDATIRHWAAARGLCNGGEPIDIERINRKRTELGLAAFVRPAGISAIRAATAGDAR